MVEIHFLKLQYFFSKKYQKAMAFAIAFFRLTFFFLFLLLIFKSCCFLLVRNNIHKKLCKFYWTYILEPVYLSRTLNCRVRQHSLTKEYLFQFARIGSNLNQLAKWGKMYKSKDEVLEVLSLQVLRMNYIPCIIRKNRKPISQGLEQVQGLGILSLSRGKLSADNAENRGL